MKFNKIYAFIFALSLFLIDNPSAKANILDSSIRDSSGNAIPELNIDIAGQCYKAYSYNRETMSCFSNSYEDELGYNYILIESGIEDYPYYVFVLSHYNKFRTSTNSDTYYYGGRYYLNENATIHLGYYFNERFSRYDFDFGLRNPSTLTISANYQFLGYYAESLSSLESATIPETSYNSNNYYNNIYHDGLFMKFKYSTSESKWIPNGGGTNFMLYNPSTEVKNVELDEYNHANILYSSFDIYDYDNETIVHESDYVEIPDIKTDIFINYVEDQGDYQASVNIYDTQPGWYYEITDMETGYTTSKTIDSSLQVHSTLFMGLTHNKIYYLKIWNNENKDVLYYSNSLQAIIDESKPHVVIKTLVENEDGSHTIDYYFKNTTSKNICSYTTADIDWISHDCSLYTEDNVNNFTLVNNGLFGVRIREINTNDIVDEYLFNFVNNTSNPYITFTGSMSTTTRIYTLNYHTYNYSDTDNLYYSKDGINWIYLEFFDSSIDFIENNIDVYFKLEDKDGNLKYQTVTKVSYNKDGNYDINSNQDISSMFGKLTQFLKPINYVIDRCVDLYNVLPGKVQDYFFILFLLGIITIVISIIL